MFTLFLRLLIGVAGARIDFGEDEGIFKVASNADEAYELVEAGFEFVCSTPDDYIVFRKRK